MTEPRIDIHHWSCSTHVCCPSCLSFHWYCPACGSGQGRQLPDASITFPSTGGVACSACGLTGLITLLGWHPTTQLQQAFDLPAAQRPQGSQKRLSLHQWANADPAIRKRLHGSSAAQIAAIYRRQGRQPQRAPDGSRPLIYTHSELIAALDLIAPQQGGRRG